MCKALRKKQTGEFIVQFRNFFLIFVIVRTINIFSGYFENNYLCTSGTIRWEKIDIGKISYYSADFKASFTCEYDETIANFNFSIENLEFL